MKRLWLCIVCGVVTGCASAQVSEAPRAVGARTLVIETVWPSGVCDEAVEGAASTRTSAARDFVSGGTTCALEYQVSVDGVPMVSGTEAGSSVAQVAVGTHRLAVSADGFVDARLDVPVTNGRAPLIVRVQMWPEVPELDRR